MKSGGHAWDTQFDYIIGYRQQYVQCRFASIQ